MPKLECAAHKCLFNKNSCCHKGEIEVSGINALTTSETCCDSFELGKNNYQEEYASEMKYEKTDVWCDAKNCYYQNVGKCHVDDLKIKGSDACECQETCCESFITK